MSLLQKALWQNFSQRSEEFTFLVINAKKNKKEIKTNTKKKKIIDFKYFNCIKLIQQ